jgi:hypothetical protein
MSQNLLTFNAALNWHDGLIFLTIYKYMISSLQGNSVTKFIVLYNIANLMNN